MVAFLVKNQQNISNMSSMKFTNHELKLAQDFIQYTDNHIFLTGKAGTGKTLIALAGALKRKKSYRQIENLILQDYRKY